MSRTMRGFSRTRRIAREIRVRARELFQRCARVRRALRECRFDAPVSGDRALGRTVGRQGRTTDARLRRESRSNGETKTRRAARTRSTRQRRPSAGVTNDVRDRENKRHLIVGRLFSRSRASFYRAQRGWRVERARAASVVRSRGCALFFVTPCLRGSVVRAAGGAVIARAPRFRTPRRRRASPRLTSAALRTRRSRTRRPSRTS